MVQPAKLAKRSEKGLLTPDNCVVALIDLQPQMLFGVGSHDRQTIVNNNLVLAKAAKVFGVPVVLSTVESCVARERTVGAPLRAKVRNAAIVPISAPSVCAASTSAA